MAGLKGILKHSPREQIVALRPTTSRSPCAPCAVQSSNQTIADQNKAKQRRPELWRAFPQDENKPRTRAASRASVPLKRRETSGMRSNQAERPNLGCDANGRDSARIPSRKMGLIEERPYGGLIAKKARRLTPISRQAVVGKGRCVEMKEQRNLVVH